MFIDTNEVQENQSEMFMDSNYTISEAQEIRDEMSTARLEIEVAKGKLAELEGHKIMMLAQYKWTKDLNKHHVSRVTHHKAIIANNWAIVNELYSMLNKITVANQEGVPA